MPKTFLTTAAGGSSSVSNERGDTGLLATLLRRLANLMRRRRINRIEDLDDRVLEDIGLVRSDVVWARGLPLDQNPIQALKAAAHERRIARIKRMRNAAVISRSV